MGSLFAANLAQLDDAQVWAYDNAPQAHVDAINEHGLRLTGAGDVLAHLTATTDPAALPECDFGIVATKSMHTLGAIAATARAFANGAVATVQNGAGNEEVDRRITPPGSSAERPFPARQRSSRAIVQWDVKGVLRLRAVRAAVPRRRKRSSGLRMREHARRHADVQRSLTCAGPQWRKVGLQRGDGIRSAP